MTSKQLVTRGRLYVEAACLRLDVLTDTNRGYSLQDEKMSQVITAHALTGLACLILAAQLEEDETR